MLFVGSCGASPADSARAVSNVRAPLIKGGAGRPVKHNFVGVFRPATAAWVLRMSRPGWRADAAGAPPPPDVSFTFGNPGDTPLVGDWNGDGIETPGVWRDGVWRLTNQLGAGGIDARFRYGGSTDAPLAGDWDGDGIATPGVFRHGVFRLRNRNDAGPPDQTISFGDPNHGYLPLAGDWDGDGFDTVGLYDPSSGWFHLTNARNDGQDIGEIDVQYGNLFVSPVMGDWNGDGVPTIGVVDAGHWFLDNDFHPDEGAIDDALYFPFGQPGDVPLAGNWDPGATTGTSTAPPGLATFFPIGVDYQPSSGFAKWKERGINTVIRQPAPWEPYAESIETWTARANQLDLKMIRDARPDPADDAGESNLLAWITFDEPETLPDGHARVRARHEYLRSFGARPVFVNFNGAVLLPAIDDVCGGPGDLDYPGLPVLDCYPDFIDSEDWVSEDYYPVNFQTGAHNLGTIGQIVDKLTRWSRGKPQFVYIEASFFRPGSSFRALRPAEFRAEIWLAIIHGARGIFYFPHDVKTNNPDGTPADIVAEMRIQNARITALAPVLQSAINPATMGWVGGAPLEATWRLAAGVRHYVVLNLSSSSVTRRVAVTGFVPDHAFEVVGEGRTVGEPGNPSFVDAFGPWEIHVYRH